MLVAADAVRLVGSDGRHGNETGLCVVACDDAIRVIHRLGVADEHAGVDHPREICGRFRVRSLRMRVGAFRQVDFGLRNVEEAPRAAGGTPARFGGRDDVVGRRDDVAGAAGGGA